MVSMKRLPNGSYEAHTYFSAHVPKSYATDKQKKISIQQYIILPPDIWLLTCEDQLSI